MAARRPRNPGVSAAGPAAYPLFIKQAAGGRPQRLEAVDFDELRAWLNAVRSLVEAQSGTGRDPSTRGSSVAPGTTSVTLRIRGQELRVRLELERPVSRPLAASPVPKPGVRRPRSQAHPHHEKPPITTGPDQAAPPSNQLSLFDDNDR